MSKAPDVSPGTVSKILWHFTGGPTWNSKTKRQNVSPKPAAEAYANLKSILQSRELRLGAYKEVVKVIIAKRRIFDPETRRAEIKKNVPVEIESSSVCCLADIPAPHLRYHAYRYGKCAVGFHRDAVIRAGFNPVFYTLEDTPVIRSIYEGFSSLEFADTSEIRSAASGIESQVSNLEADHDNLDFDVSNELSEIDSGADSLETAVSEAKRSLEDFVAFVKTFNRDEFSSIYCEREWRSTKAYNFELDNIAMIVLPRLLGETHYFNDFVQGFVPRIRLPRSVPVIPWDDLIEH